MSTLKISLSLLAVFSIVFSSLANAAKPAMSEVVDYRWNNGLKKAYFGDREIIETDDVIALQAPKRAENAAIVPIKISSRLRSSNAVQIRNITLLVDNNPVPLAGKFSFTEKSGRADLSFRIRVNEYTPVRAIAETSDGKLTMSRRFVKASGGCSIPAAGNIEASMARLGKMKIKTLTPVENEPLQTQLNISHPNLTGLQLNQVSNLITPAHFVKKINVLYNDELVMTAETDISISQDPSFRFYFTPDQDGELRAEVVDSQDKIFSKTTAVKLPRLDAAVTTTN